MTGAKNVVARVFVEASEDDSFSVFSDGRWTHAPTSDPKVWWPKIPLSWPVTAEFGSKVLGMVNRVPKLTWEGAHNR